MAIEQALLEQLEGFEQDMKWLSQHYERLKQQYPDEYVAVLGKAVVDHDADLKPLMCGLEAKYPNKSGAIAVDYVAGKKLEFILL